MGEETIGYPKGLEGKEEFGIKFRDDQLDAVIEDYPHPARYIKLSDDFKMPIPSKLVNILHYLDMLGDRPLRVGSAYAEGSFKLSDLKNLRKTEEEMLNMVKADIKKISGLSEKNIREEIVPKYLKEGGSYDRLDELRGFDAVNLYRKEIGAHDYGHLSDEEFEHYSVLTSVGDATEIAIYRAVDRELASALIEVEEGVSSILASMSR